MPREQPEQWQLHEVEGNPDDTMVDKIKDGVVVTMAYRMTVDGQEIEDAPADDPLYYLHGSDNIVPGLEAALKGKAVGDKLTVELAPDDAYGEYDKEAVQAAEISDFDLPEGVKVGDEVEIEDAEGDIYVATIQSMDDETIELDFNSALAGKTVTFDVEVLEIREATEEELEFGEPAEYADLYDDEDDR